MLVLQIISRQYLDEDWNFDHSVVLQRDLPVFIENFYEEQLRDIENSPNMRILFNTHLNISSTIIKFNLNTLRGTEMMLGANLYVYWVPKNDSNVYHQSVVLRLYQIVNISGSSNESELLQNPDVHKLSNVIYASKAQKGWQTFKITKTIDNWLAGEDNRGLLLTVSRYDSNELIEIFNDTCSGVYGTFVAVKVKNPDPIKNTEQQLHQKSVGTACRKISWDLSIKQLGWDSFIIAPSNFKAYDCTGNCALDNTVINHVKLLRISKTRMSYCVPYSYNLLPVMYYDRYNNVVLKKYDNIIVTNCGCR
nr:unnamed protein product [Callosobruchus chinensis]